jgi:hypothetical protein
MSNEAQDDRQAQDFLGSIFLGLASGRSGPEYGLRSVFCVAQKTGESDIAY